MKKRQKNPEKKPGPAKRVITKITKGRRKSPKKTPEEAPKDPTQSEVLDLDASNATQLAPIVRRAMELQGFKFALWEIAETVHHEFKLNRIPSEATIWRWINEGMQAYVSDIKAFAAREVASQLHITDQMLRTWLPRAMDELSVRRMRMRNGEMTEEIDESAYDEKVKATQIVDKMLAIRRDVLGIKDGGGLPEGGAGTKTTDQLHKFLLEIATKAVESLPSANLKVAKPKKEILTLESGAEYEETP